MITFFYLKSNLFFHTLTLSGSRLRALQYCQKLLFKNLLEEQLIDRITTFSKSNFLHYCHVELNGELKWELLPIIIFTVLSSQ